MEAQSRPFGHKPMEDVGLPFSIDHNHNDGHRLVTMVVHGR
jgi:hypothetical protein